MAIFADSFVNLVKSADMRLVEMSWSVYTPFQPFSLTETGLVGQDGDEMFSSDS